MWARLNFYWLVGWLVGWFVCVCPRHAQAVHDRDLSRFLGSAVSFLVYSVLLTSVLGTFGIDTKPLIAGIGISGFVVGFALKEIATK